jgi:hypothetical protein
MKVSMIKLVSGETLLAEFIDDGNWELSINNPVEVIIKMGNASPILMSHIWMPLSEWDNYFSIRHEHIILEKKVDEDMISYYNNCIDTIHENMTSGETFLVGAKKKREAEELTQSDIDKVLSKIEKQVGGVIPSANTVLH